MPVSMAVSTWSTGYIHFYSNKSRIVIDLYFIYSKIMNICVSSHGDEIRSFQYSIPFGFVLISPANMP